MSAYGTDDGFTAWLTAQGMTLPVGAPSAAVLRQIGSSYVDAAYGAKLTCSRKTGGFSQELQWPRTGHVINGELVPDDLTPPAWIHASYRAAYLEATNPGWATGSSDPNRVVKREKVDGAVEVEYFGSKDAAATGTAAGIAADAIIGGMVNPWLCSTSRRFDSLFRVI